MFARRSILKAYPRITYPRRVAKSREAWGVLDRLNTFIGGAGPDVALWLTRLWDDQQRAVTYKELRETIERGFMTQAELGAWQSDYVNFVNSRLRPAWEDAVRAGAASLAAKHPDFFFDPGSQGIRHWMEAHGAEWVTRCTAQQREAIAAMVGLSASGFWTVDELARAIRPTIGLNRPQAGAALRYYRSMKDSLLKDNPGMRESTAEKRARHAAAVYAQRQHRARAYTIARTELAFAFNKGQDEAVKQAIREGYMGRTEKVWSTAGGNACPVCAALEGTVIEVGGEFDFPGRNLYDGYRETPPAHPNCCCAVEYREIEPPRMNWEERSPERRGDAGNVFQGAPMEQYRTAEGDFDLDVALADYEKFLQTVSEKNRILLQYAKDRVGYRQTKNPKVVFAYDKEKDTVLFNPGHPLFYEYDFRAAMTHELGHRIDRFFVQSAEQPGFITAIQEGRAVIDANPKLFIQFCEQNDKEGFLSDIMSAICGGKYKFPAGHDAAYWTSEKQAKEIFANLFGLEAYNDTEKLTFLKEYFPSLVEAFNGLEFLV